MRNKVITKDCPSCNDLTINDDGEWQCLWGKSKQPKILGDRKGKFAITCGLLITKGEKNALYKARKSKKV